MNVQKQTADSADAHHDYASAIQLMPFYSSSKIAYTSYNAPP